MVPGGSSWTHPREDTPPSRLGTQGGDPGDYPGLEVMSPSVTLAQHNRENRISNSQIFSIGSTTSSPHDPADTAARDAVSGLDGRDKESTLVFTSRREEIAGSTVGEISAPSQTVSSQR